eukprot:g9516.t1
MANQPRGATDIKTPLCLAVQTLQGLRGQSPFGEIDSKDFTPSPMKAVKMGIPEKEVRSCIKSVSQGGYGGQQDEGSYPETQMMVDVAKSSRPTSLSGEIPDKSPGLLAHPFVKEVPSIPLVFLITDGAVENEKEICNWAEQHCGIVRLLTCGIGPYCNWYFLQKLAEVGRGFNANVVAKDRIHLTIKLLLDRARVPVFTNISLHLPPQDRTRLDCFPSPLPDLFLGNPLLVSGKYSGTFPPVLTITGTTSDGRLMAMDVTPLINPRIPVRKITIQQQIEILSGRAWLTGNSELEQEIIQLAVDESMPSKYTTMVAYECKGGEQKKAKDMRSKNNAAYVAGATVGGVLVLGGALAMSGDVGNTIGNVTSALDPVEGLGQLLGTVADCDCSCLSCLGDCPLCGEAFTSLTSNIGECCGSLCGQCGPIGDVFKEGWGFLGQVCGPCLENVGDVFQNCFQCCGPGCESMGSGLGEIGNVCHECLGACEGVFQSCSACFSCLTSVLG